MAKGINKRSIEMIDWSDPRSCILIIVMAKPIQLTSVRAVPFNSGATAEATKFENCGESAVTAIPHIHQPAKNRYKGSENRSGEIIQRND